MIIYQTFFKVDAEKRLNLEDILSKLSSIKNDFRGNNSVQQALETLNTKIDSDTSFSVEERTMGSRDLVKELTKLNLDAQNPQNITQGTFLHDQKMSNLCVYFAILSALRHEIKNMLNNLISKAVNFEPYTGTKKTLVAIPAGKSIDELLKEKNFAHPRGSSYGNVPNALSFVRMLSVLLGCVSPKALSGKGRNLYTELNCFKSRNLFKTI